MRRCWRRIASRTPRYADTGDTAFSTRGGGCPMMTSTAIDQHGHVTTVVYRRRQDLDAHLFGQRGDRGLVLNGNPAAERGGGHGPIHDPGVEVEIAQLLGPEPADGALAGGRWAVNGDSVRNQGSMFPFCTDSLRAGKRDMSGCLVQRLAFTWRQVTPLAGPQISQRQGSQPDPDHALAGWPNSATMRRNWRFRPSRSVTLSQLVDTVLTRPVGTWRRLLLAPRSAASPSYEPPDPRRVAARATAPRAPAKSGRPPT